MYEYRSVIFSLYYFAIRDYQTKYKTYLFVPELISVAEDDLWEVSFFQGGGGGLQSRGDGRVVVLLHHTASGGCSEVCVALTPQTARKPSLWT